MPNTLNFAVDKLSANRRPCRGVRLHSRLGKIAPLLCKFWRYKVLNIGIACIHFIVPTILTTSFPRKLENSATERPRLPVHPLTAPAHPTPIDVIYRAKCDTFTSLQAMVKNINKKMYEIQA